MSVDEYERTITQLFLVVKEKYLTIDGLFKAYDQTSRRYIEESDMRSFFEDVCFVMPEKIYSVVMENLKTPLSDKIYLLNLYKLFGPAITDSLQ